MFQNYMIAKENRKVVGQKKTHGFLKCQSLEVLTNQGLTTVGL